MVETALGVEAGLGGWFVGVLFFAGLWRFPKEEAAFTDSATTAHRALSECEWPDLGMPWGTARSNADSVVVCSRCGGA